MSKAWSSSLPEFCCSSVKSTWYSGSRKVAANTGTLLEHCRNIAANIVARGVELCFYNSTVSCQWPNVLPGVSALSWGFVVNARTGVKDSTAVPSTWLQSAFIQIPKCSTNIGEASPASIKIIIFDILFLSIIFLLNEMLANCQRF